MRKVRKVVQNRVNAGTTGRGTQLVSLRAREPYSMRTRTHSRVSSRDLSPTGRGPDSQTLQLNYRNRQISFFHTGTMTHFSSCRPFYEHYLCVAIEKTCSFQTKEKNVHQLYLNMCIVLGAVFHRIYVSLDKISRKLLKKINFYIYEAFLQNQKQDGFKEVLMLISKPTDYMQKAPLKSSRSNMCFFNGKLSFTPLRVHKTLFI
jgi:hypothetical protein